MATTTDHLQTKCWTWIGRHGDRTLSVLVTADAADFDGTEEDAEAALTRAVAAFEKSLRTLVAAHRRPVGTAAWSNAE